MCMAGDTKDGSSFRDNHHELWRAMQAAHDEYSRTSSVLRILISDVHEPRRVDRDLVSAQNDHRAAFEAYIDARLRFSEFMLRPGLNQTTAPSPQPARNAGWFALIVAGISSLLGLVALYSIPHGQELLQLRAEHDQLDRELRLTRGNLDALSRRIEAVEGNPAARHSDQGQQISGPSRSSSRAVPQKRSVQSHHYRLQSHQEFTVSSSPRFTQVGPVRLSFRRLDVRNGEFDLFFISGSSEVRKRRLRIYQPVRIGLAYRPGSVELVVNRMSANRAHGFISIPRLSTSTLASGPAPPAPSGL